MLLLVTLLIFNYQRENIPITPCQSARAVPTHRRDPTNRLHIAIHSSCPERLQNSDTGDSDQGPVLSTFPESMPMSLKHLQGLLGVHASCLRLTLTPQMEALGWGSSPNYLSGRGGVGAPMLCSPSRVPNLSELSLLHVTEIFP